MQEIIVILRFIRSLSQWFMFDATTKRHLQEFHDCENIRKSFPDLEEDKRNYYKITITKISEPTNNET